ncbi:MAG: hypothetical protein JNL98_31555 [Bryobacterales bacterium]|nr:hypothetical protein [Bryobacterales bacterium]
MRLDATTTATVPDPAKRWADRLQSNILSGGVPGIVLILLSLAVMIVSTIAVIVLGSKLLVWAGFSPRKRTLIPFALVGVYAGLLFFRSVAPVFYRLTREAQLQRVAAGVLLLVCLVAPAPGQQFSEPVADGLEFPVPEGWIFDLSAMGANLAPKSKVGAFNRGEEYYAVRLLRGVAALDQPDVMAELVGENFFPTNFEKSEFPTTSNGKGIQAKHRGQLKGKDYTSVAWLVGLPKGGVAAVVGFGPSEEVAKAIPALESVAKDLRHRLGGSLPNREDPSLEWFRKRIAGHELYWFGGGIHKLQTDGRYQRNDIRIKEEGKWQLFRHAQNFFLEMQSDSGAKRFLRLRADGDVIKSDTHLAIKPLAAPQP